MKIIQEHACGLLFTDCLELVRNFFRYVNKFLSRLITFKYLKKEERGGGEGKRGGTVQD